ncbi:hypothetical protein VF21_04906 [Pseudogymnoascus sp. 05NY08]|nr:hypothetical protein VF21_04906 [Pseudogymnoascus sp. 05NY08]
MSSQVRRITLFKIPDVEDQKALIAKYNNMQKSALKDGKPYIVSVHAGKAKHDQRAQGYTVAALSTFEDMEGFEYYDTECEAHKSLREFTKSCVQGFCMVYFES